jgi:Tfp pilus assembly protein PilX
MKRKRTEKGSALIITLIILVLLSIIGFAGLKNSDIELFSTRNTREFRQDFYVADGGLNRETLECLEYPLYPTPEEQRNMNPFRIALAANGTYPGCPGDGDCSTTNASLGDDHFVTTNFYDYAVDFRRRIQPTMIKGESADIIYYRIFSRTDNSTAVRAEGYFRTTTGM